MMKTIFKKRTSVDAICASIERDKIDQVKLQPRCIEYLKTLQSYLQCFDELGELYGKVDPSGKLARYDMPNIHLPVQQLLANGEPVHNLVELYDVAEDTFPRFVEKLEGLLKQVRSRKSDDYAADDIQLILPPAGSKLKKKVRASQKAQNDYAKKKPGPAESWLYDIVRASISFKTVDQLIYCLELIRKDPSIRIVKSKNRFRNPALSGYRDWNLHLQLSNNGHICELQLHLQAIKEADVLLGSHGHYEFFRGLFSGGMGSLQRRLDDLRKISKGDSLNFAFLGTLMDNPLGSKRMERLADLFENHLNQYQLAMIIIYASRKSMEPTMLYMKLGHLFEKQGLWEQALTLFQEVLDIQLKEFGPHHQRTARAYNNVGTVLESQGKYDEAMKMFEQALDIRLKVLGKSHGDTAQTYDNMSVVLHQQGKYVEAMDMLQTVLEIRLKVNGEGHPDTAKTWINMGNLLHAQGKYKEAMNIFQKALANRLGALGQDHPEVAKCYSNVGIILYRQGKLEESMAMYNKAQDIRVQALGKGHPEMAKTYSGMGMVLSDQGKLEESMVVLQQLLDIQLKTVGQDHPDTANVYINMANVSIRQGRLETAMTLHQTALDIQQKTLGKNHPDTAKPYFGMAMVLHNQDKLDDAMKMYQKTLDIFVTQDHLAHTATCFNNMAIIHDHQGNFGQAVTLYKQALAIESKIFGDDHPNSARTSYNLATVLENQNRLEEATEYGQRAFDLFSKNNGNDHMFTNNARFLLDAIGMKKDMRDRAADRQLSASTI